MNTIKKIVKTPRSGVPDETEIKQQHSLFIEQLKKNRTMTAAKARRSNINVTVGKDIKKHIKTDSNFKCKFYIRNLTDVEFRYMKTFDIESDKFSLCVKRMSIRIKDFIFLKAAITSKGVPYRKPPINQLPNIKCDIQIYGKLLTNVDVFTHNYVNWDNSVEIITSEAITDLIMVQLFRLDYEVFKMQTQKN